MARRINSRLILSGKLIAETPLSVGGLGGNVDVDLALAVDGQGRLYIPGSSLTGPLRAWLCARVKDEDKEKVEQLWGFQRKKKGKDEDEGQASFVIVEDGLVCNKTGKLLDIASSEIRDGVGIDRYTGAAADKAKYNRAILPRGSRINFRLTVELDDRDGDANSETAASNQAMREQTKSLIQELWQALQQGEIRFGASKTRGLGRIKLEPGECYEQKLITQKGLLGVLRGDKPAVNWAFDDKNKVSLSSQPRMTFEIHWHPVGPLMVKAEADGLAVDMLPLVSAVDDKLALVLPGSSIKGAFRNQAERIVRTVKPEPVDAKKEEGQLAIAKKKFHEQIEVELIQDLFGEAGKAKQDDDEAIWLPGLSALGIDDCYAEQPLEKGQWSAIESATDEITLREALDKTPLKTAQQAFHVAIDRWLGGAADNMLYTVLEPHGIVWEPIRLTLDLARLPEDKRYAAIACTLLVLRDFVAGRIPLGFGTNRGMGAIEVTTINLKGHGLEGDDLAKLEVSVDRGARRLKITNAEKLNDAWKQWHTPPPAPEAADAVNEGGATK